MVVAILAEEVTKAYYTSTIPVIAVNNISLTVEKGRFLALMGPSGCGKSTLLHLLGGIDTPSQGRIAIDGVSLQGQSDNFLADFRRDKVGFVFQFYNLIPNLTAAENVELPLSFAGLAEKVKSKRVHAALKRVGLEDRADHTPSTLSGGEQQRVAIARALINDPTLLLLDEPTGDLDQATGKVILDLLLELHTEDRTIIMVTHEPKVAAVADDVLHLLDGRIVDRETGQKAISV